VRLGATSGSEEPSSSGSGSSSGSSGGSAVSGAAATCLQDANYYRHKHPGTPDLVYDNNLAAKAQKWANKLLAKVLNQRGSGRGVMLEHDPANSRDGTGENIYFDSNSITGGLDLYCKRADKSWYNEINDYSYSSHRSKNGKAVGHFTQMVWKDSKRVGFAVATGKDTKPGWSSNTVAIAVAKYSPAGNYVGYNNHKNNVLPPAKK